MPDKEEFSMSLPRPRARLSFRWQILLLGTLVAVLSVSVIFAVVATLRYTKSAVLRNENSQLEQAARSLAQEYEDRFSATKRGNDLASSDEPQAQGSADVLSLLSRVVLQNVVGTGGGFYFSKTDSVTGSYFPTGDNALDTAGTVTPKGAIWDHIRSAARAAATGTPGEKVIYYNPGILLIEAVPLRRADAVIGSAWTARWLPDLPGANRFRAYLIATGLGTIALASVVLTLVVIQNLQAAVRKVESGLRNLQGNLNSRIETAGDPKEIQDIGMAINRLGLALKEKIERERQIENQLRHSERLASLGRLVAGVAHEVRNPLATIRLRVQMSGRDSENMRVKESCAIALQEIERLNDMVNRLLSFARPVQLNLAQVDVQGLIEERIATFSDFALQSRVAFVTEFPEQPSSLVVDRNRIAQVFDNIIQNAVEAMSDSGGTLVVRIELCDGSSGVSVEFRDTGRGMNASTVSRVFDPFFTTKASGTGLGLSISHELVRAHNGEIQIESHEGRGTRVLVTLPALRAVSTVSAAIG